MKEVFIFFGIVSACVVIAVPFALLLDASTTSKGERITRLEHRVNDLEAAVACLEQSFGFADNPCQETP